MKLSRFIQLLQRTQAEIPFDPDIGVQFDRETFGPVGGFALCRIGSDDAPDTLVICQREVMLDLHAQNPNADAAMLGQDQ